MDIIYITQLVPEAIDEKMDLDYSVAQDNKSKVILENLENEHNITVLSTIFGRGNNTKFNTGLNHVYSESVVKLPNIMNLLGNRYVNTLLNTLLITYSLINMIREKENPLILFYNFDVKSALPTYISSILYDIPIILEYEDGLFVEEGIYGQMAKLFHSLLDTTLDGAICSNNNLSRRLDTSNTTIVRGKPSTWNVDSRGTDAFDFNEESCKVVYSGRFDQTRGVFLFLEVAAKLSDKYPNIEFAISGYGPASRQVESICDNMDNIIYFGKLPWEKYSSLLRTCDICINPQYPHLEISRYQFPSKLLDYMTTNNVVISTRVGDLEYLDNELVLVDAEKIEISELILNIYQYPDKYSSYRKESIQFIQKNCTDKNINQKLEQVVSKSSNQL